MINNADGSQSLRYKDGRTEPYSSDRSLTVCFSSFSILFSVLNEGDEC